MMNIDRSKPCKNNFCCVYGCAFCAGPAIKACNKYADCTSCMNHDPVFHGRYCRDCMYNKAAGR